MARFMWVLGVVAVLVAVPGCAEKRVSVGGKVTRGGQPLPAGQILLVVFVAEQASGSARPYSADTDSATGAFRVADLPPGRYRVAVQHFDVQFHDALGGVYDPGASPLVYDVTTDGQVIDIDLPEVLPARKTVGGVVPGAKGAGRKGAKGEEKE